MPRTANQGSNADSHGYKKPLYGALHRLQADSNSADKRTRDTPLFALVVPQASIPRVTL